MRYKSSVPIQVVIGAIITFQRNALGITQTRFSDLLGCSKSTLSKIESGKITLGIDNLLLIISLLNLDLLKFSSALKVSVNVLHQEGVYVFNKKDIENKSLDGINLAKLETFFED
ncbi:helix-turn-helix transcriptional regulator [Acinetobacter sp. YH12142]|uniref:helix-turn-helix domain-containing protein n=1 Tax=Acinetobacter sp. YH12142 TaxID=2601126 RepID=UPI0015D46857